MALLLDRWSAGQSGIVAADLAGEDRRDRGEQQHPLPAGGAFDIAASRNWLDEYANLITSGPRPDALSGLGPVASPRRPDRLQPASTHRGATSRSSSSSMAEDGSSAASTPTTISADGWRQATESRVVSVDYGLAPEHPYPTAVVQTAAVIAAVLGENEGDRRSVFVAGDSAGANIAAMAVLSCAAELAAAHLAGFVSIYGAYSPHLNLSSHRLYGDGRFGLSEAQMRWFWNLYAPHVPPAERDSLSPLGADLKSLPADAVHRRGMRPAPRRHDRLLQQPDQGGRRCLAVAVAGNQPRRPAFRRASSTA